jgi:hypothetical protein
MDAYLEEEFYDILTYCIENPNASDLESKKQRVSMIGKELNADGGADSMENMFYSVEKPSNIGLGGITYQTNGNIRNIK